MPKVKLLSQGAEGSAEQFWRFKEMCFQVLASIQLKEVARVTELEGKGWLEQL
jgi:hypothetical protein